MNRRNPRAALVGRLLLTAGVFLSGIGGFASRRVAGAEASDAWAREILQVSGVQGGMVVHLGCGDGTLTAALQRTAGYTVHGLDRDPAKIAAARQRLAAQGVYGPVSVEHLAANSLPYADNLLNLLVVEDSTLVAREEMLRVLAPHGVLCEKRDGGWVKTIKPRPSTIDDWSHFLHDAGNNAVARDESVGPPARCSGWRRRCWLAQP